MFEVIHVTPHASVHCVHRLQILCSAYVYQVPCIFNNKVPFVK